MFNCSTHPLFSVSVPSISILPVILRIGLGRDHGKSLQPKVTINGTEITVPTDFRGYDQKTRDSFFGVIEIPFDYSLLQANNQVVVQFADAGGYVTSTSMQVFAQSTQIVR